jgi:hypothetical protein
MSFRACFIILALPLLPALLPAAETADQQFEQLAAAYMDEFPALSPVAATALGDHRFDSQLDEVSPAARLRAWSSGRNTWKRCDRSTRHSFRVRTRSITPCWNTN